MAASYPGSIKNFLTLEDGVDTVLAQHPNERADEITAIETELGANVAGSISDLVTRLAVRLNANGTLKTVVTGEGGTGATANSNAANGVAILNSSGFLALAQGGIGAATLVGAKIATSIQLSYTGNSADNRSLTGAGFDPNYAMSIGVSDDHIAVGKSFSMDDVDKSWDFGGGATYADVIQDFITDGFQVGTNTNINENTHTYDALLLLTATGSASG